MRVESNRYTKKNNEVINHHFKWWFNISPPKGYYYVKVKPLAFH